MNTPRMTEKELAEHQRRVRISRTKTGWLPKANGRVRGGGVRSATDQSHVPGAKATTVPNRRGSEPPNKNRGAGINPAPSPSFTPFQLPLTGQLPSGKNQVQLLWRPGKVHKYANKTFTNWRAKAHVDILAHADWGSRTILAAPICLTVEYWPGDMRTRDVSGQLDALFHLLVYAKILKDDGLIYDVTWRRHELNRKCPKVIMEVSPWNT